MKKYLAIGFGAFLNVYYINPDNDIIGLDEEPPTFEAANLKEAKKKIKEIKENYSFFKVWVFEEKELKDYIANLREMLENFTISMKGVK